jgi:hypothetical protein
LFLVIVALAIDLDRRDMLHSFTEHRAELEEFLFRNRTLLNQIVRKFGTKDSGSRHLMQFYKDVLSVLYDRRTYTEVIPALKLKSEYSYLQRRVAI